MYEQIKAYGDAIHKEFEKIPLQRKQILEQIVDYIVLKSTKNKPAQLVYICTHNSRRSHFGQIWATAAATYYGIKNVKAFSGGTEVTAFNHNAIDSLKRIGFDVQTSEQGDNPVYELNYGHEKPILCFSKMYDHAENPRSEFAAIMTCSDAEQNCPFIPGVERRIATTYDDPKAFDDSPLRDATYDKCCRQIACETFYVFSKLTIPSHA